MSGAGGEPDPVADGPEDAGEPGQVDHGTGGPGTPGQLDGDLPTQPIPLILSDHRAPGREPRPGAPPRDLPPRSDPRPRPANGSPARPPGAADWPPYRAGPPDWSRLDQLSSPVQAPLMPEFFGTENFDPADDLTDESLVRQRRLPPTRGWRLALFAASGGRINPGLGPLEAVRLELIRRIRRPVPSPHRIAVVSVKGGVGKTTVAACLGLVLAELRGDRVVALDANPDAGTLSERLTGPGGLTVRDLFDDLPNLQSVNELTRYARMAGRLHVLGSEQEPALGEAFAAGEYLEVCELLARFYNIIITDSGTGLVHSAMQATLDTADSLVVVGAPTVDGASRASKTLAFLRDSDAHRRLAEQALVVLCCDRNSPDVDRSRIRAHFAARCRAVLDIPPDPHLATGGRIDLSQCREQTLDAFYLAAAYLADGFGAPSLGRAVAGRAVGSPSNGDGPR